VVVLKYADPTRENAPGEENYRLYYLALTAEKLLDEGLRKSHLDHASRQKILVSHGKPLRQLQSD